MMMNCFSTITVKSPDKVPEPQLTAMLLGAAKSQIVSSCVVAWGHHKWILLMEQKDWNMQEASWMASVCSSLEPVMVSWS